MNASSATSNFVRISLLLLLFTIYTVVVLSTTPPTFIKDFKASVQSDVVVAQGDVKSIGGGGACCAAGTPGCQLQGIFSLDKVEEQGTKERSRMNTMCSNGPCILASLYGKVMKQMELAPGSTKNSSHKFVCNQYCPLKGNFTSLVQIGNIDNQSSPVKYLGKEEVSQEGPGAKTKTCDHYQWSEMLFKVIPIQTTDFFVDVESKNNRGTPFFSSMNVLKGVGVAFNSSFLNFEAASNLDDQFDIDPASFANCPLSSGCSANMLKSKFGRKKATTMTMDNKEIRLPLSKLLNSFPKFSADFFAYENSKMLSNQGGSAIGTDICCLPTTKSINGECLVTRAAKKGMHYYDVTNQRERYEDEISGQTMVTFYGNISKDMLINITNGVETCESFCPLLPGEGIDGFAIDPNATDMGKAKIDGINTEHYQWYNYEKIPITGKLVKMQTVEFYAKKGSSDVHDKFPMPVYSETEFTPYGEAMTGSQNTTYSKYISATPPANKFKIAGIDTCPQAKNCQIELWQIHRLNTRRFQSFYYHRNR